MSLDIYLTETRKVSIFEANITHNLTDMADQAGLYKPLWQREEVELTTASHLIQPLEKGIADMEARPDFYKTFDAPNGWGTYKDFVPWLKKLLDACKENPGAEIEVST